MIKALAFLVLLLLPFFGYAHAFDERYDLPIPLSFFISGALLIVGLSYLLAVLFIKEGPYLEKWVPAQESAYPLLIRIPQGLLAFIRGIAIACLCFIVFLALAGPKNPLMNISSHFIWINWWIGVPLLFALFGSIMHCIDPFEAFIGLSKRFSPSPPILPTGNVLFGLGKWPAVFGLLVWCWIEVVYPNASLPYYLGAMATIWLASGIVGRFILGDKAWNENWDFFRNYFSYFGLISPFYCKEGTVYVSLPFVRLIQSAESDRGNVAFVIAMLSIVLFDGLHSSTTWLIFQVLFEGKFDGNGYVLGFLGVLLVWAFFYLVFLGTCLLVPQSSHARSQNVFSGGMHIAGVFAPSLIPIALAYHLAHNFSSLVVQGQFIFFLASDPLGKGWNLFGTANLYPNIAILDAKTVWYVALSAIVIGHVVSIFLVHLVALREFQKTASVRKATLPLTILMIFFTAVSLIILAEPLVS